MLRWAKDGAGSSGSPACPPARSPRAPNSSTDGGARHWNAVSGRGRCRSPMPSGGRLGGCRPGMIAGSRRQEPYRRAAGGAGPGPCLGGPGASWGSLAAFSEAPPTPPRLGSRSPRLLLRPFAPWQAWFPACPRCCCYGGAGSACPGLPRLPSAEGGPPAAQPATGAGSRQLPELSAFSRPLPAASPRPLGQPRLGTRGRRWTRPPRQRFPWRLLGPEEKEADLTPGDSWPWRIPSAGD